MEAEKCTFPPDAGFHMQRIISACGGPAPRAESYCPHAESQFLMRKVTLRMWRSSPACGEPAQHAESQLRMQKIKNYTILSAEVCSI